MSVNCLLVSLPFTDPTSSTRWQAQVDAVSVIHSAKMRVHPQSAVGLMSMGGKGPEVLSTFTSDFGGILSGLHQTKIFGTSHLGSSIQVAGVCSNWRRLLGLSEYIIDPFIFFFFSSLP